jgi:predicted amidohydrolase
MSDRIKAAIIQHAPVFLDTNASLELAQGLLATAASAGAQVVAFPETWLSGYAVWLDSAPEAALWGHEGARALYQVLWEQSVTLGGDRFARLCKLAVDHGVHLAMGLHERRGGSLCNSMALIAPNGEWRLHRKLVPTYTERLVWGRGDGSTLRVLEAPFGPLGGLICWEHWMPLARAAMHDQQEVIHVAQWPTVNEVHLLASRQYAFEGQCFVLAAGTVLRRADVTAAATHASLPREAAALFDGLPLDEFLQSGQSAIIAPDAGLLAGPAGVDEIMIVAELDLAQIVRGKLTLDVAGHYARPDVFELRVDERPQPGVCWHGATPEPPTRGA